jgi:hypothetical protein
MGVKLRRGKGQNRPLAITHKTKPADAGLL